MDGLLKGWLMLFTLFILSHVSCLRTRLQQVLVYIKGNSCVHLLDE